MFWLWEVIMIMKRSITVILSLVATCLSMQAQQISEEEALDRAMANYASKARVRGGSARGPQLSLAHRAVVDGMTCYYVFNNADGGYVIVGGDEVAYDILGYSDEGRFEYEELPDNLRWWMDRYERQIRQAIEQKTTGKAIQRIPQQATAARRSVAPLLGEGSNAIQWNQYAPYNLAIDGGNGRYLTGCTSTAGAQVMKFYEHPAKDTGIRYAAMALSSGGTAPAITSDYTYNWSTMQRQYASGKYQLSDPNAKDVANLFYRLGRSIGATYGTGSTSASVYTMGAKMIEHFGYDKTMYYAEGVFYSDEDLAQLVYDEVYAGRPVVFSGQDMYSENGHAFVCDGYDGSSSMYHINWGWAGSSDNYFRLSGAGALQPDYSGAGGAGDGAAYCRDLDALVGIMPDKGNGYNIQMMACRMELGESTVKYGKAVVLKGIFQNVSYGDYEDGAFGLAFCDVEQEGTSGVISRSSKTSLKSKYFFDTYSVNMPADLQEGHRYRVVPVWMKDGIWTSFKKPSDEDFPVMTVTEADRSIRAFCLPWTLASSTVALGGSTTAKGGFGNDGDFESVINFGFRFTNVNDSKDCVYSAPIARTLNHGSYYTSLTMTLPGRLTVGKTYQVTSVYKDENGEWQESRKTSGFVDPQVTVLPPDGLAFVDEPTVKNGGYFTGNDLEISFTLVNQTGSDYNTSRHSVWIFPGGGGYGVDYFTIDLNIKNGESKSFTIGFDDLRYQYNGGMELGSDYYFRIKDPKTDNYISNYTPRLYRRAPDPDVNHDGEINVGDVIVIRKAMNDGVANDTMDFDYDHKVDNTDIQVIVDQILK